MKEVLKRQACKRVNNNNNNNAESSLNEEILNLQKQLQDQFSVRHTLENALRFHHHPLIDESLPNPTKVLIKEITVLELEILYLERQLLCLYRKSFDQHMSSVSTNLARVAHKEIVVPRREVTEMCNSGHECEDVPEEPEKLLDSSIHRSHSSLSARSFRASPPRKFLLSKAVDSYHSLPLSMLEQGESSTPNAGLAEQLGTCWSDRVTETPNSLSEEMIRCISGIYCELADPPSIHQDCPSASSSNSHSEKWSSISRKIPFLFNSYVDNPFQYEGSEGLGEPYCGMMRIQWIHRDAEKLKEIETMLQKFRSIVYQLEDVDLRKLKHEEKLAFWINVHNSLVMHAFLVYGVPQNNLKRVSLVLKAAYNVGGHTISVDMIQNSILGCRLPRPGQWLRLLFSSKTKFKVGDARKAFTIEHPEPLLHFALCSGNQSDPAVRVYTPKRVFEEMEAAREDYIRSSLIVMKEQKILLPKIVESFAKDSGLSTASLIDMVEGLVPENSWRKFMDHNHYHLQHKKSFKGIEWIPHNFTFHYLLSKELTW